MGNTIIQKELVDGIKERIGIATAGTATIREIKKLVDMIEGESGTKFIRMEMGVPGLPPAAAGIEAEIEALRKGVAAIYPDIMGVKELKSEISLFVKNFLNVNVNPEGCIPTVGSMQGGFAAFMMLNRLREGRDTLLFLDPGFPVHKQQMKVLGNKFVQFDVYNYRGEKLREKLESVLSAGNIHSMLYSNPNNPTWICFTEVELKIIAELAAKYDVVVIEDLAYFAMDFRKDYTVPGQPPFQPTIANYYDKYILMISSSKAFSYAGQRIGMMVISDSLFVSKYPDLKRFYVRDDFGHAMIFGTLYALSSGAAHSTQYGLLGILKAVNSGQYRFRDDVIEYGRKAGIMKKMFTDNGFKIVYDMDEEKPIADGFYFTVAYPGLDGGQLLDEFLYYGISAIALGTTGSERTEGIRACVSLVLPVQFPALEERLKLFHENHK
ncbi:MAG: aminotransferase [Bacteroidetes bacterium HGW-Bacteroidetes-6]|jgi:aspartate/methionine/tyrosine aminotransferase|nr:MAG: aminotransferase [Bacteroidetes bacterium HGW-Bacteroidetes-6]